MKTIVAFGLMALFLFMVVVEWGAYRPSVVPASASATKIRACVSERGHAVAYVPRAEYEETKERGP